MALGIEDFFEDILGKAQYGLGIDTETLAEKSGVEKSRIQKLRKGELDENALLKVAPHLNLHPESLLESARKSWYPDQPDLPEITTFSSHYGDMVVNAYLYQAPGTNLCVLFDTGTDASPILKHLRKKNLQLEGICLTHSHPDHIAELQTIRKQTNQPPAWIHLEELVDGATPISENWSFMLSQGCTISARKTNGHSQAGLTYLIEHPHRSFPIAIVGDAMFAGSMGGGRFDYNQALATNRSQILTLPDDTPICPGHGPISTVGQEKAHNPFFPEFK
jgi:hydroxyacylglutathione hydrolase